MPDRPFLGVAIDEIVRVGIFIACTMPWLPGNKGPAGHGNTECHLKERSFFGGTPTWRGAEFVCENHCHLPNVRSATISTHIPAETFRRFIGRQACLDG